MSSKTSTQRRGERKGRKDGWIRTVDELPQDKCCVLIYEPANREPISVAFLDRGHWTTLQGSAVEYTITHWRSLPESPK